MVLALTAFTATAQEIIKETPRDTVKPKPITGRAKVDGVVAVVGDYVVLDSDIDMMYREMQAQKVAVRARNGEDLGVMSLDTLLARLQTEAAARR